MSSQNPVFIPGPTNIPERLRHAVNVLTLDHRSASFDYPIKLGSGVAAAQEYYRDTASAFSKAA